MSTLRGYPIPNLINGVSQQAPQQRRDSQCDAQENCFNSPVFGNSARPGTSHAGWFPGEDFTNAKQFDVIRSLTEQYRVVIDQGSIRVFDLLTGNEGTVEYDDVERIEAEVFNDDAATTAEHTLAHDYTTISGQVQWTIKHGGNSEWTVIIRGRNTVGSGAWTDLHTVTHLTDITGLDVLRETDAYAEFQVETASLQGPPDPDDVDDPPDDFLAAVPVIVSLAYDNPLDVEELLEYLESAGPSRQSIAALTIEDTTYIANREIPVAMLPAPTVAPYYMPDEPEKKVYEAFIHFKAGDYLATYTVYVNNRRIYFSTRDGSESSHAVDVKTNNLAAKLFSLMTGGAADPGQETGGAALPKSIAGYSAGSGYNLASDGFLVTRVGNLIRLRRTEEDGGDFTIQGFDNANGDKMLCIKDQVQRFAQLPNICFNQTILRVRGGAGDGASPSDYYVEFEGAGFEGTWRETAKPGATRFLNRYTMPHRLVSLGNNQFRFGSVDWASRIAGDGEETAKDPGFVGKFIEDITLWRDRMGLVHEAGCALSKTSRFVSFFPSSVQTALDDDPIDFRVANPKIAIIRHAVAHSEQLFLWAPGVQFGIEAQEALTQASIEIEPTTDFSYDPEAGRPIGSGDNIVFVDNVGPWAAIREQFATVQGVGKDYSEVSSHAPAYVPAPIKWFACDDSLKCYVLSPVSEPNVLYVYQYLVIGEEKQQSAWQRWVFPKDHTLLHGHFWNGRIRLSIQRTDGVAFETLDLSAAQKDEGAHYLTRLDRKVSELDCTWEYTPPLLDDEAGITHITVPYSIHADEAGRVVVITREGGSIAGGEEFEVEEVVAAPDPDFSIVRVRGEIPNDVDFWVGLRLGERGSTYLFSPFIPKDDKGPFVHERVQVRAVLVTLADTGWTEAIVRYEDGREYTYQFTGRVMGSPTNLLDQVAIAKAAVFRIPIKSEASRYTLELVNDSPLPSSWQSAEIQYRAATRAIRSG